jgi:hypothetical protein
VSGDLRDRARRVVLEATAHAASLGVDLHVDYDVERRRLSFSIYRNDAPVGSGAQAIRRLVDLADEADVEVTLDVMGSEPKLVEYYWRFGFRMCGGDLRSETDDLALLRRERETTMARRGSYGDPIHSVVTMWRERHAGPLTATR